MAEGKRLSSNIPILLQNIARFRASSLIRRPQSGDHSVLILAARITLLHLCVSSAISRPKSPELIGIGTAPNSVSRALSLGSARLALISLLSLPTIATGVACGTPTPNQLLASLLGKNSPTMGRSGNTSERRVVVTASACSLPALINSSDATVPGTFQPLFDDTYVVAAGVQSPWARRRRITLAELVSEPWTLPPLETPLGSDAMEIFRAGGLDYPRVTIVIFPALVRLSLLATGRFLTVCSSFTLRFPTGRAVIKVLPIELPIAPVPVGVFTLKNRTLSPVVQLFIDAARDVAKTLTKGKR